jgi:hypothetical protein
MENTTIQKCYDNLAKAICYQAMADYMSAAKRKKKIGDQDEKLIQEIHDLEEFLESDECEYLSGLQKGLIINRLKEMISNGQYTLYTKGFIDQKDGRVTRD